MSRSEAVATLRNVSTPTAAEVQLAIELVLRWAGPSFTGAVEIHSQEGEFQVLRRHDHMKKAELEALVSSCG